MSRMSWRMMAAFFVMGVMGLMLLAGPWSPRMVEKDPAGVIGGDVSGPPRPLAPGTPITPAETSR